MGVWAIYKNNALDLNWRHSVTEPVEVTTIGLFPTMVVSTGSTTAFYPQNYLEAELLKSTMV